MAPLSSAPLPSPTQPSTQPPSTSSYASQSELEDIDYESLPTSSVAVHMMAGALAGITEHSVMFPFDSIKTRMQILNSKAIYSSISHAFAQITTTEGFYGLWRGVNSVIVGAGPAHALQFATYEHCKTLFGANADEHTPLQTAAAGVVATLANEAFMNPFDVIKQRMQIGTHYRGVLHCASDVLKREGIQAFYVSYPTTLVMQIPFQSIHYVSYEFFRKTFNPSGGYDPKTHIAAGAIAGALASTLTNPIDVCKTILQTRGSTSDPEIRGVNGLWGAAKLIYKRKGLLGFVRGVKPRILAHAPATAICWTTYETLKHFLSTPMISEKLTDTVVLKSVRMDQ
ncbi:putative mitochondrial carrier protein [Polychytrium aggregatum]|uniref:putative mitochondrial carrier protein n=1 Tax=Polychytrium aggregatum TaxID=110093 RepID=UPI0022FE9354|nr:putative mitochondrial carrier protein [Polychytrium aggregatum]KAI9199810.1 putative mitochondrial carrier protein [Polychytrium aggregatum]